MQVIEISTDFANVRVVGRTNDSDREWLHRHALHQLMKQYRKDYGAVATRQAMDELESYHAVKVVGVK